MRAIVIICLLVVLEACSNRVFYYQGSGFNGSSLQQIPVSPNRYTVYLREVCSSSSNSKTKDTVSFQECPPRVEHTGFRKIEVEYLFVSNTSDTVIYISNFPDKYEAVYEFPDFQFTNNVKVNAFYFGSFYIGKIDRVNHQIRFNKSDKKGRVIDYSLTGNRIEFRSITETKKGKPKIKREMTALSPVPAFNRYDAFYWMFNLYKAKVPDQIAEVLTGDTMYIDKNKGVYFYLRERWNDNNQWIRYKKGRLVTKQY